MSVHETSLLAFKEAELPGAHASSNKNKDPMSEILNAMLPPREFVDQEGVRLVRPVSTAPGTREDAINLQLKLDERLSNRQAREFDICPVREVLYAQAFDELIRQETCGCPERGAVLLQVRDEVRMTIAAYQTLYQSSVTFGADATHATEQSINVERTKIAELKEEKARLESLLRDRTGQLEGIEKQNMEKKQHTDKRMGMEKDFQDRQTTLLDKFIADANSKKITIQKT